MSDAGVNIPTEVDHAATEAAATAIENAPVEGDTLALVSGGHDSLTAMHVAYAARRIDLDGVVHVNTGIGISETRQFAQRRARELGLTYYEVGAPCPDAGYESEYRRATEEYTHLIHEYGFPGPPVHKYMYANLKEKPLQRWLSEQYPDREVTLISGVRRHESATRMENVNPDGYQEFLGAPTVSPLVEFSGLDVRRYRRALGLPMNPVVDALEMSGECLCGAHSGRGELRMLRLFYPAVYRYILALEASVSTAAYFDDGPDRRFTRWGHNRLKQRELAAMDDDSQMLLCATCEQQASCDSDDETCDTGGTPEPGDN